MRIIPGNTKVRIELFKGVSLTDMIVGGAAALVAVLLVGSSLPFKWIIAAVHVLIWALLIVRIDAEPNYVFVLHILKHLWFPRKYERMYSDEELQKIAKDGFDDFALKDILNNKVESEFPGAAAEDADKSESENNDADVEVTDFEDLPTAEEADDSAEELEAANNAEALDELLDEADKSKNKKKKKEKNKKEKTKKSKKDKDKSEPEKSAESSSKKAPSKSKSGESADMDDITSFTGISDGYIEYGKKYYGAVLEIPPVEFRFFSEYRRTNAIENGLGSVIRSIRSDYSMNIVKIERPIKFDAYIDLEYDKLDMLKASYTKGMIKEEELKSRVEIVYDRLNELLAYKDKHKIITSFYYIALFDSDKQQLDNLVETATESLRLGEMNAKRLNDKELAVFLKYSNTLDFDENEIDSIRPEDYAKWAQPQQIIMRQKDVIIDGIVTHNMRIVNYPSTVSDAWLASLMSYPSTKVVVKAKPMDRGKSIQAIDRSLSELRVKYSSASTDSKVIELGNHIETLQALLVTLQNEGEALMNVNVYISAYDIMQSMAEPSIPERTKDSFLAQISHMKKNVKRSYNEQGMKLNAFDFNQTAAYIGSQVSGYDPMEKDGRGMPSNTVAATFPWVFSYVMDKKGVKLGTADGVPVMVDFFRRDSERVNSNMVIVGKSGSGKSYATKSILANLAADDSKIFILDPENEYAELAKNFKGKFINVANAQYGRLNPFHIITALDDDEENTDGGSNSYATHLQFLEEFFTQILPDCDKDALEYLNSLVDRTYSHKGINENSDFAKLRPEDYPIFDDLYDEILKEFQRTDNDYIRTMLRTLMNYISKFSTGGRNSTIWNGPSSVTTEENFTVFNFQSLLANRNATVANAQMLLVLKYIDNEIIKNRDYNTKYGLSRKVVVVIDEAHVFIDSKFPVALDFMFQLAKRIRKYNGMQIVITQNIKDFVGSEDIARKSSAIINACQYSFIFSLSPNDMGDLCKLYEKAGGINEQEQERIIQAPRGQAFTILSPASRSSFKMVVPDNVRSLFEDADFQSHYFSGEQGQANWEDYIDNAREEREVTMASIRKSKEEEDAAYAAEQEVFSKLPSHVNFVEFSEDDYSESTAEPLKPLKPASAGSHISFSELSDDDGGFDLSSLEIPDIPEEPGEFESLMSDSTEPIKPAAAYEPAQVRMAAPQYVQPQVIVQAPPTSSKTEELLTELLSKFSHDSLMEEIRMSIEEIVERKLAGFAPAAPAAAAASFEAPASEGTAIGRITPIQVPADEAIDGGFGVLDGLLGEDSSQEEEEDGGFDLFASLMGEPDEGSSEPEFGLGAEESDSEESHFDIMEFLAMEAEKMDDVSPIDEMIAMGESKCEITLEQLAAFIINNAA